MTATELIARAKEIMKDKRFIEALGVAENAIEHYMDAALDSDARRGAATNELKLVLKRRGCSAPDRIINLAIELAYCLARHHDAGAVVETKVPGRVKELETPLEELQRLLAGDTGFDLAAFIKNRGLSPLFDKWPKEDVLDALAEIHALEK